MLELGDQLLSDSELASDSIVAGPALDVFVRDYEDPIRTARAGRLKAMEGISGSRGTFITDSQSEVLW